METAHVFDVGVAELQTRVRNRYVLLGTDALNGFLIFYGSALRTRIGRANVLAQQHVIVPAILLFLLYDFSFGLHMRALLHGSARYTLRRVSECWSFFTGIATYVCIKILVEAISAWVDDRIADTSIRGGLRVFFVVFYTMFTMWMCVLVQQLYSFSAHELYYSQASFINRMAFGVSVIISNRYFASGARLDAPALVALLVLLVVVQNATTHIRLLAALHPRHRYFLARNFAVMSRVVAFILIQSLLDEVTGYFNTFVESPSRIFVPILLLLMASAVSTVASSVYHTMFFVSDENGVLIQDMLFGLTIFVSQFCISEIERVLDVSAHLIFVTLAIVVLVVVFSLEVIVEQFVNRTTKNSLVEIYETVYAWTSVVNRLLIYIIIQIALGQEWDVYKTMQANALFSYAFPAVAVFATFMFVPDIGTAQSERIVEMH